MRRVDILGVSVDAVDLRGALGRIGEALRARERLFVITVNPEFVMLARRDPELRALAGAADLAVPDGVGIVFAGSLLRRPLPGRAPGRELVRGIATLVARERRSVYLLGAGDGIAARAGAALRRAVPELVVAGAHPGTPEVAADGETRALIDAARPDVLLVAYGMPKQERWIARNLPRLATVRVAVGVGGAFDYLAGVAPLPPAPVARLGLEWLWRLLRQPWRWRRQRVLPAFAYLVLRERLSRRKG